MTTEEFNALIGQLTGGLPVSLVMSRLNLTLWAVVYAGGGPAQTALRDAVAAYRSRDAQRLDPATAPAPAPKRQP